MAAPGDLLVVVHEFLARSPDELTLARGDRIELIERDDDFGDGWFLGRNTETGDSGLFPEVYTRPAPAPIVAHHPAHQRHTSHPSAEPRPLQPEPPAQPLALDTTQDRPSSQPSANGPTAPPMPLRESSSEEKPEPHTSPLQISNAPSSQPGATNRASLALSTGAPRSISLTLSGDPREDDGIGSPVMHETLSVIDEHITDMSTPRHSTVSKELRANESQRGNDSLRANDSLRGNDSLHGNDSGSEYSSRLSYINGQETEEEESNLHSEKEVLAWSPARVAEYLEDVGVDKKHCNVFKEQEINGEVLLGMDQATIFLKEFELGPVGPRLRTWLKIKALQQEVKDLKETSKAPVPTYDGPGDAGTEPVRHRATSMSALLPRIPSLSEGHGPRGTVKQPVARAFSTSAQPSAPIVEATSPLVHNTPSSPGTSSRPSAASVRDLNHNRRHSSVDYSLTPPAPSKPFPQPTSHKKTPSFDRNWTMGSPQKPTQSPEQLRPSSSNHVHSGSMDASNRGGGIGFPSVANNDLDRGYFSGNEVDNRKSRNVLRKRESASHSRNPSFGTETGRATPFSKRHSRVGSTDTIAASNSPVSPAVKQYFGSSIKTQRSSGTFDIIRPLKPMNEGSPTVTKLGYADSPSIDAIANSPGIAGSETSSQGRASPSPAHHSHSFFGRKSKNTGLRAISDAITGGEKAHAHASPAKDSPLQSPARTGSSTPSGTSATKSLDLENPEVNKRLTGGSASTGGRRKSKKHGTSAYTRGREQITPQEAIAACDYSGWMKKKSSSLMTTWKTRLFVLRGRRLSYFYSEMDTEEKGLIDISSHRVLPANNERMTGFHAAITRAGSTPTSPHNATIPTAASADSAKALDQDVSGMFIFKLVPPRVGLQKGVQFTSPQVHYFAVDNVQQGRLWMAALMKATIDRDDALSITSTYQQKTISLEKARAMRQRPPALMDEGDDEEGSTGKTSKESIQEDTIHEEEEVMSEDHGLAISGLDDAKALLDFADGLDPPSPPKSPSNDHKKQASLSKGLTAGLVSPIG